MENLQDNTIIICPNEEKLKILDYLGKEDKLHNIKFMTKEEYKKNYFFDYDELALEYLINKYNYNLDICKVYLENLYVIDENKKYKSAKLNLLVDLKKELMENNLLYFNKTFKKQIKNKSLIVKNYYDLDLYEESMLNTKISLKKNKINVPVIKCNSIEEEVNYVALKIIELLRNNIDINKIYLTNVSNDYFYTLNKIFSYYNIPINLDMSGTIYSTKVVSDYLNNNKLDLENKDKAIINRKLINVLSTLTKLDETKDSYKKILIDKLKSTKIGTKKKHNAINLKDIYKESFNDDEYVFVLGFNQDSLPKMEKDILFINDSIKDEVKLYKTSELNKRNKEVVESILSNIKNLYLSYKLSSPFATYYKSSLIDDLKLQEETVNIDNISYSNKYNKILLAEKLDLFHLYGQKDNNLSRLLTHYKIPYKTYKNDFTGINNDKYLENLPYPLNISYTSLNTYNECKFKYYIKNVLKLDPFQDTFASFIGSMYHRILQIYKRENFDFEIEYQKYLEERDLSLKEKLLLVKIKKDLQKLITCMKEQELLTGYNETLLEKKIEIPLDKKVSVVFKGFIDKIMYYEKVEDTYFSIVDYKTGTIDTNIEPMKYGLHMQLPVYLYLIHYGKTFDNPIFTGIYYQNILFNYPTYTGKDLDVIYKDKLKLQGYSTTDTTILERFDPSYENSEYIKSLKFNEDKGFGTYSKVIDNDTLYDLVKYTKNHIDKQVDSIIDADFKIDPKVYAGKNVSCEFCSFKDLCFMKESDLTYLEKQVDLSFLGGEE